MTYESLTDDQLRRIDSALASSMSRLRLEDVAVRSAREILSRRAADPVNAAAVALADVVVRNADHWDAKTVGVGAQQCIDNYRAARAAATPQPDEARRIANALRDGGWLDGRQPGVSSDGYIDTAEEVIRAALAAAKGGKA